jgi:preprotein translocase SecE subunit
LAVFILPGSIWFYPDNQKTGILMAEKTKSKTSARQTNTSGKSTKQTNRSGKAATKKPNVFQRFAAYMKNVRQEIRRTSWPTRGEVGKMSALVIGALLFFGITIFALDGVMTRFVAFYATLAPEAVSFTPETPDSAHDLLDQIAEDMGQGTH